MKLGRRLGDFNPQKHVNADGTFNGVTLFAELTGLSSAEIDWTWKRLKALVAEGKTNAEAKAVVREEARARPWERG